MCIYIYVDFFLMFIHFSYISDIRAKMSPVFSGYQQVTDFSFITEMCGLKTVLLVKKLIRI